jgi:hypothetical protein
MPGCCRARTSTSGSAVAARRRNSPGQRHASAASRPSDQPPNGGRLAGQRQGEPFPRRHPAGGPPGRAERRDEHQAADPAGSPRRARRRERSAARDAEQRRRGDLQRVQNQGRILSPVREQA